MVHEFWVSLSGDEKTYTKIGEAEGRTVYEAARKVQQNFPDLKVRWAGPKSGPKWLDLKVSCWRVHTSEEGVKKEKFLRDRGWGTWYNPDYWVHPKTIKDPKSQDYTNYGLNLDRAVEFETSEEEPWSWGFLSYMPGGLRVK